MAVTVSAPSGPRPTAAVRPASGPSVAEGPASTLSSEQLTVILGLLRRVDSVELKFTVPDDDRRSAVAALGIDPLEAQIRQVVYFDTPDLQLNQRGVVVRVRRVQGKSGDSVVKLRPVVPDELPTSVRNVSQLHVEVDAMPGGFVCSGTMKAKLDPAKVKETLAGRHPLGKLFSREQRDLYANARPVRAGAPRARDARADQRAQAQVHAR